MKILIAYQYFSFRGGIEHVITEQSKLISGLGNDVKVLTSSYLDNKPLNITNSIPIIRMSSFNYLYTKFGIPFAVPLPTVKNIKIVNNLVKEADVINLHGHPYLFSFIVTLFCIKNKKPVVLTQHNTKIVATNPLVNFISNIADHTIGWFNIAYSSNVVTVSNETKHYVTSIAPKFKDKITTIYNGIDYTIFKPSRYKTKLREELGLPKDSFICLTVRRITFKNGIDTLLQAAEIDTAKKVLFLIGGTGPDLESAKKYLREKKLDNVKLLGFIPDEELPKYYAAADCFVLPSRPGEGFPMVVLEALSAGLPVVATRSGGHIEVINNSENGYIIAPEKPEEIVQKVNILANSDISHMAKLCREIITKRFTWSSNVSQLMNVINGVSVL